MNAPVCIVTGANSGIGKAATLLLAKAGATVIMACRNEERGEKAKADVIEACATANVVVMPCDTSSFASVRAFADAVLAQYPSLDVLINNGATFDLDAKTPVPTEDGFETVFATNYLGPWLLTTALLDLLKNSSARVLNVDSKGLLAYPFLKIDLSHARVGESAQKYSPQFAYYHSKLALTAFTVELAARLASTNASANTICVPAVKVAEDRLPRMSGLVRSVYNLKRRFALAPEEMAETYAWLALDSAPATWSGERVDDKRNKIGFPRGARDPAVNAALWDATATMVELRGEERT